MTGPAACRATAGMRWYSGGSVTSPTPGARCGISITACTPTCPGHRCGRGALVSELFAHPLKDPFDDGKFVPLGPHLCQLLGQLFFEFVELHAPRGDPFQQFGIQHVSDRRRPPGHCEQALASRPLCQASPLTSAFKLAEAQWYRVIDVHQHAVAQHRVPPGAGELRSLLAGTVQEGDGAGCAVGVRLPGGAGLGERGLVRVENGDVVSAPSETLRLDADAAADIENALRFGREMLGEGITVDELALLLPEH